MRIEEYGWDRIAVDGADHGHAFSRAGGGTRTTVVTIDGPSAWVVSGLTDLVVLKSTGSEFRGFPRDRYTSLGETTDRILATAVTARWRYSGLDVDQTLQIIGPNLDRAQRHEILQTHVRIFETKHLSSVRAFSGVREVFEALAERGGKIALATECKGPELKHYLRPAHRRVYRGNGMR